MTVSQPALSFEVESPMLDRVLSPYKPGCKYLRRASVETPGAPPEAFRGDTSCLAIAHGDFAIPGSWYIQETGHFNAIEFNLSYNQLVYTLLAACVQRKLVPGLSEITLEQYWRSQLPDVLILEFKSRFSKAMQAESFGGSVWIAQVKERRSMLMLETHCLFADEQGGRSQGDVTLAILKRPLEGDV